MSLLVALSTQSQRMLFIPAVANTSHAYLTAAQSAAFTCAFQVLAGFVALICVTLVTVKICGRKFKLPQVITWVLSTASTFSNVIFMIQVAFLSYWIAIALVVSQLFHITLTLVCPFVLLALFSLLHSCLMLLLPAILSSNLAHRENSRSFCGPSVRLADSTEFQARHLTCGFHSTTGSHNPSSGSPFLSCSRFYPGMLGTLSIFLQFVFSFRFFFRRCIIFPFILRPSRQALAQSCTHRFQRLGLFNKGIFQRSFIYGGLEQCGSSVLDWLCLFSRI